MRTILLSASLTLSLLLTACAGPELKPVGTHPLRNGDGHVIGHKQILLDVRHGGEIEEIVLYKPRLGAGGEIVGYEETVGEGAVLRDLDGRRIGMRQVDLRSRSSNPGNPGITTLFSR
jgi:hypothetical protein